MNENFKGAIEHILQQKFGGNMTKMASALGFSPQQVSQWVGGKSKPSMESCIKISDFLGLPFEQIRDGEQYLDKPPTLEARLQALEEKVEKLIDSGPQATTLMDIDDEDISRVVELMRRGSAEFRRIARKTLESLKDSF